VRERGPRARRLTPGGTMDFDDTPEETAFRREAYECLAQHATPKHDDAAARSYLAQAQGSPEEVLHVKQAKEWQATLYEHGWGGITWPPGDGGRGGTHP